MQGKILEEFLRILVLNFNYTVALCEKINRNLMPNYSVKCF